MNTHIKKVYVPMTETGFYILLCLRREAHGYSIIQEVDRLTDGEIRISPGTMYGSLSKMEKDGLIRLYPGGGQTKDLLHYRSGLPGTRSGNETN